MLEILRNRAFRQLFAAQVVALLGTGLATVALALLAYDLAGDSAGEVLGTALAIKMVVYVILAPLSGAVVPPRLRKRALVALDLVRAAAAAMLPFVSELWQVYLLIAVLQSASACFTPLFQSLIPEILVEERDYTRALSLSRMAYDLENLLSPSLAAALLAFISFHVLFAGTSIGFIVSSLLVAATLFPLAASAPVPGSAYARALHGMRIYLRTPRLRGLLALNLVAAAGGAMVFVNTVVIVRGVLDGGEREVAWALAAFGGGSMLVALLLPRLLERASDRRVMLAAASAMVASLLLITALWNSPGGVTWLLVLSAWAVLGMAYAGIITPGGRLLRRSGGMEALPFLFAAQFSLAHVCWLIAYPLAGSVGARYGMDGALGALSAVALLGLVAAWRLWPANEPEQLVHGHDDLPGDHPHLREHAAGSGVHAHRFIIDELHQRWPR